MYECVGARPRERAREPTLALNYSRVGEERARTAVEAPLQLLHLHGGTRNIFAPSCMTGDFGYPAQWNTTREEEVSTLVPPIKKRAGCVESRILSWSTAPGVISRPRPQVRAQRGHLWDKRVKALTCFVPRGTIEAEAANRRSATALREPPGVRVVEAVIKRLDAFLAFSLGELRRVGGLKESRGQFQ